MSATVESRNTIVRSDTEELSHKDAVNSMPCLHCNVGLAWRPGADKSNMKLQPSLKRVYTVYEVRKVAPMRKLTQKKTKVRNWWAMGLVWTRKNMYW